LRSLRQKLVAEDWQDEVANDILPMAVTSMTTVHGKLDERGGRRHFVEP
jgi:hypothetical protein